MTDLPTPQLPTLNGRRTMAVECSFVVPGEPVPKARARVGKGGRFYTPKPTEEFEKRVRLVAQAHRPTGWPMRCRYVTFVNVYRSTGRGDDDNYLKAVKDALNPRRAKGGKRLRPAVPGVLWSDDGRGRKSVVEVFDDDPSPRVEVRIVALPVRCKLKGCGRQETYFPDDEDRCETCAARRTK